MSDRPAKVACEKCGGWMLSVRVLHPLCVKCWSVHPPVEEFMGCDWSNSTYYEGTHELKRSDWMYHGAVRAGKV